MLRLSTPVNAEVEYPCLSGERRHLPCVNFKDSARPAELPPVAQLVQHLPRTQKIAGSSPARGSSSFSLEKKRVVFGCRCLHLPCLYN